MSEPRPKVTDEMIRAAAESVVREYLPDVDMDASVDAICRQYRRHMDGYDLSMRLRQWEGWDVTRDEMESLDAVDSRVSDALREAEKQWFAAAPFDPPFPVGTTITQGLITGIYEYGPARYLVKKPGMPEGSSLIINFENAKVAA